MNEVPSLVAEPRDVEPPDLNAPALLDALRQLSGEAEQQDGSLVVPHHGSGSADKPLLTVVMAGSPLGNPTANRDPIPVRPGIGPIPRPPWRPARPAC